MNYDAFCFVDVSVARLNLDEAGHSHHSYFGALEEIGHDFSRGFLRLPRAIQIQGVDGVANGSVSRHRLRCWSMTLSQVRDLYLYRILVSEEHQRLSEYDVSFLKKNLNAPRPSEHPPVRGKNLVRWRVWRIINYHLDRSLQARVCLVIAKYSGSWEKRLLEYHHKLCVKYLNHAKTLV